MRVIIFGAARDGLNCYFDYEMEHSIIAFVDNNIQKQGKKIFGVDIIAPEQLIEISFDRIYITSEIWHREIRKQLKELGIEGEKIRLYERKTAMEKTMNYLVDSSCAYCKEIFEEKWQKIKAGYDKINLYALTADAIGEVIPRFLWIKNDIEESKELDVFIPVTGGTLRFANKEVLKQIQKQIYIVGVDEIAFWMYVIYIHGEEINIAGVDKYIYRNDVQVFRINEEIIKFDVEDLEKEQLQLKEISASKPYVCFLARTANYNLNTIGKEFDYDHRNMNFLDYQITIDCLKKLGITSVRMGRTERPIMELRNCVDYAGTCASDFGDLALIRNCKFMVSSHCGAYLMAYLFSKPVVVVNLVGYSFGCGALGYTGMELFIPKKVYSVIQDRLLSINEIMDIEQECLIWGKKYKERGVEFVDNTPEEICEAVEEMQKRLNGTWVDTPEDQSAYEKYLELHKKMEKKAKENERNWTGGPIPYRIAASYLRKNMYLLD